MISPTSAAGGLLELVEPGWVDRWVQLHAGLAVGTNKFSNTVTADEVNGSNRRRCPALWAGSIKRLKVTMMACSAALV